MQEYIIESEISVRRYFSTPKGQLRVEVFDKKTKKTTNKRVSEASFISAIEEYYNA